MTPWTRAPSRRRFFGPIVVFTLLATACGVEEIIMEPFRGETPHERYQEALERAGLSNAELTRGWTRAASEAIRAAVDVVLPKEEVGRFGPEEPMALGYRVELRRGQQLEIRMEVEGDWADVAPQLFMDLFRVRGQDEEDPRLLSVAWSEPLERSLTYEARASASYILRIQPELLAGGDYRLAIRVVPSLAFPVEGRSTRAIQSFFGDARDGGRRDHHGVDIFAPRGTPVLSASSGVVRRVAETPIGGRIVWVRDEERGLSLYYAHLDRQHVTGGERVQPGDTLGFVGNTGNARTTPPHLHFGIYMRGEGPVDPWSWLHDPGGTPAPLRVEREAFRQLRVVADGGAAVRASASPQSRVLLDAEAGERVRIVGGSGSFLRIRLPDGTQGYLPEARLAPGDLRALIPSPASPVESSAAAGS
jgi:peptidoglycan LD-endopeptidase LytH